MMYTPELARDLDVLMRCGHVQIAAASIGRDTPAGWFQAAADAHTVADAVGRLARMACQLAALDLSLEESS